MKGRSKWIKDRIRERAAARIRFFETAAKIGIRKETLPVDKISGLVTCRVYRNLKRRK